MLQHLEESERGDVDRLCCIDYRTILRDTSATTLPSQASKVLQQLWIHFQRGMMPERAKGNDNRGTECCSQRTPDTEWRRCDPINSLYGQFWAKVIAHPHKIYITAANRTDR